MYTRRACETGGARTCRVEALHAHLHKVKGDGAHEADRHDAARAAVHAEGADWGARHVAELVEDPALVRRTQQLRRAGAALGSPARIRNEVLLKNCVSLTVGSATGSPLSTGKHQGDLSHLFHFSLSFHIRTIVKGTLFSK